MLRWRGGTRPAVPKRSICLVSLVRWRINSPQDEAIRPGRNPQNSCFSSRARPTASILGNKKDRHSQCVTDILDTIPAPTHPSTGTTARRRSSISRRVMRRRAATYRSRQPSPRRLTARSRTASSRAKAGAGRAARASRAQTLKDGARCP